ncbi:MAG: Asp-tRNA(Asn)/Glu-tRNA(Gln) amidotransferase subunit GatA [Candidatus Gracilibacteria bacterium]|jgi:aspartyl-tRNA(Asn)/glutamyl-tRNA(Gln) amidotransferase subunit A
MLSNLTLAEAHQGLKEKKFSSVELTTDLLGRIEKLNPALNAYITVSKDEALKMAKAADEVITKGNLVSPLTGIPIGVKDLINTKGVRTTCASGILKDFIPPYDATVIEKLKALNYVLVGKTNLDEFACGGSTEHSYFGPTKNPWDLERVAGGSSGGSAAAVAADMSFYSLGTDTGGSIREPASFCSAVGLKVTYGRVSRSGVTALASSWDTIGPFAKTVQDAALVLKAIAGKDPKDATTLQAEVPDYAANLGKSIKGLKIGVPKEYFGEGIDPEVEKLVRAALKEYEKMGAILKEVSLPYTSYAIAVYYVAMPAELSANLARFDGIRFGSKPKEDVKSLVDYYYQARKEGFGDEIKRRIMIGTYVLSAGYYDAYYLKAQKVRTLIIQDFENAFKDVDVLMSPVVPFPAFKVGEKQDPLSMYLADALTIPVDAAGIAGLSLPCGFTASGLPVGLQIIGPQLSEGLLLNTGAAYEQATDWHKQKPKL